MNQLIMAGSVACGQQTVYFTLLLFIYRFFFVCLLLVFRFPGSRALYRFVIAPLLLRLQIYAIVLCWYKNSRRINSQQPSLPLMTKPTYVSFAAWQRRLLPSQPTSRVISITAATS